MDDDNQPLAILSRKKYDVFISFRGEDTRANFTSHLHKALKDGGIETYIDEDKLERGQEISKALLEAIENSKISIVVFSQDYASSKWCLNELAHILRCVERKTHIVVPVFYHVDPTDVRKQKRSYEEAFEKHDGCYDDATIRKWRDALTKAANHSGWDVSKFSNEAEAIHKIFDSIREKLRSTSSSHHNLKHGIVGIDNSIADLHKLLSNSRMVGICGMGGLGKTTLAQIVFNQLCHQYNSHYFFQNVREEYQKNGSNLVLKFFRQLSNEKCKDLVSLKERLRHKKLLIVLDDVDDLDQYNCLLEHSHSWLNSESRLIITSRNHQVLRNIIGNDEWMIYNLKGLKEEDALELFCLHAFKRKSPEESYKELSLKFVKYAQGLPLALKVLGSHLFSKSKQIWQSLLSNIKEDADQKVTSKLKISFDGLDPKQQSIFLDIACFFQCNNDEDDVKEVLNACYDCPCDSALEALVDNCLIIRFKEFEEYSMHDLLREMGRSIIRGSDHNNRLENYDRLWRSQDVCTILENNTGTSKIQGIYWGGSERGKKCINLDPSVFKKMSRLKFLQLSRGKWNHGFNDRFQFPHGLDSFPKELRYLDWYEYPLKSLGSSFTLHNLVHLSMPGSELEKLPDEFQDLENLKYVDLNRSYKLTCLPDLSKANLWKLDLRNCTSLVKLPPLRFHNSDDENHDVTREAKVIYSYETYLWFMDHEEEEDYDDDDLINYHLNDCVLDLRGCCNLTTVSKITGNIKFLLLSGTAIEELKPFIGSLNNLLVLKLNGCHHLKILPDCIYNCKSLAVLDMNHCKSIDKFPKLPESIQCLDLSRTSISEVNSESFQSMPLLKVLYMDYCTKLESLPNTICKLKSIKKLSFYYCSQLKRFPEILELMTNLQELHLKGTEIDTIPPSIENLCNLEILDLKECKSLKSIPLSNIDNICSDSLTVVIDSKQDLVVLFSIDVIIFETLRFGLRQDFRSDTSLISILKWSHVHHNYEFWKDINSCLSQLTRVIYNILKSKTSQDKIFITHSSDKEAIIYGPRLSFWYSGNKIPYWCSYRIQGSKINEDYYKLQDLSTRIHHLSFYGIVICIVVDFGPYFSDNNDNKSNTKCKLHFCSKHSDDHQPRSFDSSMQFDINIHSKHSNSDHAHHHVFIFYLTKTDIIFNELHLVKSASFEFYIKDKPYEIKECGISLTNDD